MSSYGTHCSRCGEHTYVTPLHGDKGDQGDLFEKARAAANPPEKGSDLPQVPGTIRQRVVGRARLQDVQDENCVA